MSTLKQIKAPISDEIAQFNKEFISNIKTEKGLLDKILRYIIRRKGKQIRPILVLFNPTFLIKILDFFEINAATIIKAAEEKSPTTSYEEILDKFDLWRVIILH